MKEASQGARVRRIPTDSGRVIAGSLPFLAGGRIEGSLDTILSRGQLSRVRRQNKRNDEVDTNESHQNFVTGLVSEMFTLTSKLDISYGNYGLFLQSSAFHDTRIVDRPDSVPALTFLACLYKEPSLAGAGGGRNSAVGDRDNAGRNLKSSF